ncbi:microtubule-associated protein Jupiter [Caerostris extrusa]|uniref:Microtubule-associated protein Jupiter n=1 Tax=Caerostris extrusa TaxID=172846 RepID=A0AAV4MXS8_CAEEX|nr:microtubule-associated protein Jupiter [Caerostris extrusa]
MTSTEFTVGLEGARNSSKVLKPPGGGSSDIFGCASAAQYSSNERQKNKEAASGNTQNRLFGTPYDTTSNSVKKQTSSTVFASEPPAAPRSAKKSYVRRNPITGEEIEIYPENEKKENGKENEESEKEVQENGEEEKKPEIPTKPIQTSIRVRNPPGGKSSGIF